VHPRREASRSLEHLSGFWLENGEVRLVADRGAIERARRAEVLGVIHVLDGERFRERNAIECFSTDAIVPRYYSFVTAYDLPNGIELI
jgi:predicted nucleotidyltransferase